MESKRQSQQEGDQRGAQILAQSSKRRHEDSQQVETGCIFGNWRSIRRIRTDDIVPCVTDLARRVVQEVLERKLLRSTINQTGTSGAKFFHLVFSNELSATSFTLSKIKAKDGRLVEIALYDIRSQSIVTEGPLSSIKIEICVLNGEFDCEDWTADEFKDQILRQRDNKGNLLKGDTVIILQNGVGHITKISFTDNSSWTRSRHFRLGAKVVQSTSIEANIREGRSNPIVVKDSRGELNQKHYPPSLDDEIWRLEKISKSGEIRRRLSMHGINTVKDLLQLHETNPSLLQKNFGKTSTKLQEAIIEHAKTCVSKVTLDGQNYPSQNTANSNEKPLKVEEQHAYRNVKDLVPSIPLATPQSTGKCDGPNLQLLDLPTQQDQQEKRQDIRQPSTSTSHIMGEAAHSNQVGFVELLSGMCMDGNGFPFLDHNHIFQ